MPPKVKADPHLAIAHVLFIDVVGYSKLLVNEQREVVDQLTRVVRKTPQFRKSEAAGKLIRIPVGDGMALVFFETPEEPVQCAMEIARALKNHPRIRLRMGVHSGPVDQVKDVNDRLNVAGSGMNTAQRVMDCGDAGHILLSRRVAEDLAQDSLWQPHLHELGEIEVKHGAKLGIVNLHTQELGNPEVPRKLRELGTKQKMPGFERAEKTGKGRVALIAAAVVVFAALAIVVVFWSRRGAPKFSNAAPPAAPAALGAANVPAAPEKSIAVLPFDNLSDDKQNAYFANGVQDEILTYLAKIADLKVISRMSVRQYKSGNARNLREIGEQLGVAHLLEGSVQRSANRVRVNAQLIDARNDAHLWAQTYDRDLADVFAIQSEIAKTIADHLQAKLSPNEKAAIEEQPTTDLRAYECYIKGKDLLSTFVGAADPRATVTRAIELLQEATEIDSHFLLAYCKLVEAHLNAYTYQVDPTPARLARAKESVDAAIQLRPDAPETHLAQAWYAYVADHDYNRARDEVAKALSALPNNADALGMAARIDRRHGRWDDCLQTYLRAKAVDPGSTEILRDIASTFLSMRRYSDSERFAMGTLGKLPEAAGLYHYQLGICYLAAGQLEQAKTAFAQMPLSYDPFGHGTMNKVMTALYLRDYDSATQYLAAGPPNLPDSAQDRSRCPRSWFEAQITRARGGRMESQAAFAAARDEVVALSHDALEEPSYLTVLARIDAALGRKAEALREARHAVELRPISEDALEGPRHVRNLAIVYALLGEGNAALEQLEKLVSINGGPSYGDLRFDPQWDSLRGDSRFEKLVEEVKQPVAVK